MLTGFENSAASPARILIVDDDPVVRVLLRETLHAAGFDVDEADSAGDAEPMLASGDWSLMLLDRRLPDCDGLLLLSKVKERGGCPVIVLSVLDDERDRTLGLGLGASDYISKPFSTREVLLRVNNVLQARPAQGTNDQRRSISYGPFCLYPATRRLLIDGAEHHVTAAESRLLAMFLSNPGEVISREQLTRKALNREWFHNDRSIDVLVARLRKLIEPEPKSPCWLITVHRVGYVLDAAIDA